MPGQHQMLSCTFCAKTFPYGKDLDRHMMSHTKEKPHKCLICGATFGLECNLKNHVKTVHDGVKQIPTRNTNCPLCSYSCYSKNMLQRHLQKHSTQPAFSCDIPSCGFKTKHKVCLERHVRNVHSDERPYLCPSDGCTYKAKNRELITRHLKVHSNDRPFTCTVAGCNHTSKTKDELKAHTSRVHSNEKPFKCSVCDFRTKSRKDLIPHELTHTNTKRFQCQAPNCGFASHLRGNLKVHFDRKHKTQEVICSEPRCNFRCGSVFLLKRHLQKHKLPKFKCPGDSCGFRTKYNSCLLRHISSRHSDYQSSATMAETSVSDPKTAGTMKTLQSSFTDFGFKTKFQQHYDRHVATHKNEETGQHVCSFCFSSFRNSPILKAHFKTHIREKPYSCSHCSYATMSSFQLKTHARNVHQIFVIPCGEDDQVKKCRTCSRICFSYGESVLHSMSHLQPVVVLEQLKLLVL